jgi:hypothetical protein
MLRVDMRYLFYFPIIIGCVASYWHKSYSLVTDQVTKCVFTSMNKCDSSFISCNVDTIYLFNNWLPSQRNTSNVLVKDTIINYNNNVLIFLAKKPSFNIKSKVKIISYSINKDKIELQYLTLVNDKEIKFVLKKIFLVRRDTLVLIKRVDTC